MASLNGGQPSQIDESMLKSLSEADKRELQQTLGNEMQKARLQECGYFASSFSISHLSLLVPPLSHPTSYLLYGVVVATCKGPSS